MLGPKYLKEEVFWHVLEALEGLKVKTKVQDLCKKWQVSEADLMQTLYLLHLLNCPFTLETEGNAKFVKPPAKQPVISFQLKLSEWLSLQSLFPLIEQQADSPEARPIIEKLEKVEKRYSQYDLYGALMGMELGLVEKRLSSDLKLENSTDLELDNVLKGLPWSMDLIKYCILHKRPMAVEFRDGKSIQLFPHRMVYLEGILHVVGEEIQQKYLLSFQVQDVVQMDTLEKDSVSPFFSQRDVEDFIKGMTIINEKSVRLILKVQQDKGLNLVPLYHYLGNPVTVANPRDEIIWAATVEPCEDLFEWLYKHHEAIQVIDPVQIKTDFHNFIQEKLKKAA